MPIQHNMKVNKSDMINFYLTKCKDKHSFSYCRNEKCKAYADKPAKKYKQAERSGYTNLLNHLRSCVGNAYESVYLDHVKKEGVSIEGYFFGSSRDNDVYQLIEWVIVRN